MTDPVRCNSVEEIKSLREAHNQFQVHFSFSKKLDLFLFSEKLEHFFQIYSTLDTYTTFFSFLSFFLLFSFFFLANFSFLSFVCLSFLSFFGSPLFCFICYLLFVLSLQYHNFLSFLLFSFYIQFFCNIGTMSCALFLYYILTISYI